MFSRSISLSVFVLFFLTQQFTYAQKVIWPSSYGGNQGGGSIVGYDLQTTAVSEEISQDANFMGMYHEFTNNFETPDGQDDPKETNGLFIASDGYVYGLDIYSGVVTKGSFGFDAGVLFRFHPDTLEFKVLHYFEGSMSVQDNRFHVGGLNHSFSSPRYGLAESGGSLYGVCIKGGEDNRGGVWKYNLNTHEYSELTSFKNDANDIGFNPNSPMFTGPNNDLFFVISTSHGSGAGALIQIDISEDSVIYKGSLDAAGAAIYHPYGKIIYEPTSNRIYGTKRWDFYPSGGGVYTYDFAPLNGNPNVTNNVGIFSGSYILGSSAEGMIKGNDNKNYAVTSVNAAGGKGALLVYSISTNSLTKIHDFEYEPNGNSLFAHGTKIWGTYNRSEFSDIHYNLWSYDVSTGILNNYFPTSGQDGKGIEPQIAINNNGIYMMMKNGLSNGTGGIVFFDFSTLATEVLISGDSNGAKTPVGSLVDIGGGEFIGLTKHFAPNSGYSHHEGCIVKYDINSGVSEVLTSIKGVPSNIAQTSGFSSINENSPELVLAQNNKIYFNSVSTGIGYFAPFVDEYAPRKLLWEFDYESGALLRKDSIYGGIANSDGSPCLLSDGNIAYTSTRGVHIFEPNSGQVTEYDQLMDLDQYGAFGGQLIEASNGKLYGVTQRNETLNLNCRVTLFELDPVSNYSFSAEYTFDSLVTHANEGLVEYNGILYGSTSSGGANNHGYLFSFDISSSTFSIVHDFERNTDGALFEGKWGLYNDSLIGVSSSGGGNGYGTIALYDIGDDQFYTLENLTLNKGFGYKSRPVMFDETTLQTFNPEQQIHKPLLHPNPCSGVIKVSCVGYTIDKYVVLDLAGRTVGQGDVETQIIRLDNLPDGTYIIKLWTQDDQVFNDKIVIE